MNASKRLLIFGASKAGRIAWEQSCRHEQIIAFVDNDPHKHGTVFCGLPVVGPEALGQYAFDGIRIASNYAREIYQQLIDQGFSHQQIDLDSSPPDSDLARQFAQNHAHRLKAFHNRHAGEDCFIIGNGPSLNKIPLDKLVPYHAFGLNKLFLLYHRTAFRPSYHVSINELVIEQSADNFKHLDYPSFLSFAHARHHLKPTEQIHYIHTNHNHRFSQDATLTLSEGSTVTYVAMQLAWYMGFQTVYLIGVDHAFTYRGKPNEKQRMAGEDPNHFDPDYFANQSWHLPDLEGSAFSYRLAHAAYQNTHPPRQIMDATIGGQLTLFPKIDFELALKQCRPKHS